MNDVDRLQGLLDTDQMSSSLGMKITEVTHSAVILGLQVKPEMTNGFHLCHGGVIFTLADTALAFVCIAQEMKALTQSVNIEFMKPAQVDDQLRARAVIVQRKKRSVICDVTVENQRGEIIALVRGRQVQIAVSETP